MNEFFFPYQEQGFTGIKSSYLESAIHIVTIVPIFVGTCDLERIVASGHKQLWRPPAANMGFCDFKDVVAFGNNQLWRPLPQNSNVITVGYPKDGHYRHNGLEGNRPTISIKLSKYEGFRYSHL